MLKHISEFKGRYICFSNFSIHGIWLTEDCWRADEFISPDFLNTYWRTSEHLFQSFKTFDREWIWKIHSVYEPDIKKSLNRYRKINSRD